MKKIKCQICPTSFVPRDWRHVCCSTSCGNKLYEINFEKRHGMNRSAYRRINEPGFKEKSKEWIKKNYRRYLEVSSNWRKRNPNYRRNKQK